MARVKRGVRGPFPKFRFRAVMPLVASLWRAIITCVMRWISAAAYSLSARQAHQQTGHSEARILVVKRLAGLGKDFKNDPNICGAF